MSFSRSLSTRPRTTSFPGNRHSHEDGNARSECPPPDESAEARRSAVAEAIAQHRDAQAALDAVCSPNDPPEHLADAEFFALCDLAETPCVDDAELFEKLRYLLAHEKRMVGKSRLESYRAVLIALELHLNNMDYA